MYTVLDYIENSAKKYPNKLAIICEEEKITYKDLILKAKSTGTYIANLNIFKKPIMIFMDKGIDTLIAFLGSVYAGCSYTLVNPEFPSSRIQDIANVLNSPLVITDDEHLELATSLFKDIVCNIKDIKDNKIDEDKLASIHNEVIDYDPLYINFTSGSTGVPKGVAICHRSVIDFMREFTRLFSINDTDIIGNQAPFDFDVSVKDIYAAFFTGATLVIIPKSYFSSPAKLLDYIIDKKVTNLTWAVSALCLITTFHGLDYKVPESIKRVIFSGEVMPLKHLNIWMEKLPNTMFVNVYGPTEITCNCTYHIIDRNRVYIDKIPAGKHFPNERVVLLDDNLKEITEPHKKGLICVSGTALALGYYNNKAKTDEAFITNPLVTEYQEMMYNTGDLGEYNEFGEIVFCGRKDFQIKYLGHRIELEEIERAMMKLEGIVRACVIYEEEKSKLYGFYIGDWDKKDLHLKLKETLPTFMIPTKLIKVDEMPLTKNGKIDRKALINMEVKL